MPSTEALAHHARALRANVTGANLLGDPPPERSALAEYLRRPPPPSRPSVRIAAEAGPLVDAATERRREQDRNRKARKRAEAAAEAEAERRREHERTRKQRWRAARRAAGLPARTEAERARTRMRRVRRKAVAEAWRGDPGQASPAAEQRATGPATQGAGP